MGSVRWSLTRLGSDADTLLVVADRMHGENGDDFIIGGNGDAIFANAGDDFIELDGLPDGAFIGWHVRSVERSDGVVDGFKSVHWRSFDDVDDG